MVGSGLHSLLAICNAVSSATEARGIWNLQDRHELETLKFPLLVCKIETFQIHFNYSMSYDGRIDSQISMSSNRAASHYGSHG